MTNKKIIIIALVLAAVLVAAGFIYKSSNNSASILPQPQVAGIVVGNQDAPVTIEEYTNFLCPACANFAINVLPQIENNYVKNGKVKFVFYVIGYEEFGRAAFCADKANKFSEFHDYVFAKQSQIKQEQDIFDFASAVGINVDSFKQCYNSQEAQVAFQNWVSLAKEKGVDATPTFFINGQKILGMQLYATFQNAIDSKLK